MKPINFILILILLIGVLFELIPNGLPLITPFVFADDQVYQRAHYYYIIEGVRYVGASFVILMRPAITIPVILFVLISFFDIVDYMLCNNNVWYYFNNLPVSFNSVSLLAMCIAVYLDEKSND